MQLEVFKPLHWHLCSLIPLLARPGWRRRVQGGCGGPAQEGYRAGQIRAVPKADDSLHRQNVRQVRARENSHHRSVRADGRDSHAQTKFVDECVCMFVCVLLLVHMYGFEVCVKQYVFFMWLVYWWRLQKQPVHFSFFFNIMCVMLTFLLPQPPSGKLVALMSSWKLLVFHFLISKCRK